jgi:hypothetical protein
MNTRRKTLDVALSVFSVISVVTVFAVPSADAQASRIPPGSDSAAVAIVARYFAATFLGPAPEYQHWIDEMQIGDGLATRTEVFKAGPHKILVRASVLGQVMLEFGSDGTTGWTSTPGTGVATVAGPELAGMRASINDPLPAVPVTSDLRLISRGKVMLEGEFTDLVLWIDADGDTTEMYYAVSSGLLSATIRSLEGGRRTLSLYRDYKPLGGEQIATTKTVLLGTGKKMITRMLHMDTDPIPDERFRRPSP